MTEVLTGQVEQTEFDVLLGSLAGNMRLYDELSSRRQSTLDDVHSLREPLEDLDLDILVQEQPPDVAYSALRLLIAERKLVSLEDALKQADTFKCEATYKFYIDSLFGQKVSVETLDPENHKLGTLRRNPSGYLDGLSSWHHVKSGKMESLHLDASTGGWLQITGRAGVVYQASPLIDRNNDYLPAFSIQLLD